MANRASCLEVSYTGRLRRWPSIISPLSLGWSSTDHFFCDDLERRSGWHQLTKMLTSMRRDCAWPDIDILIWIYLRIIFIFIGPVVCVMPLFLFLAGAIFDAIKKRVQCKHGGRPDLHIYDMTYIPVLFVVLGRWSFDAITQSVKFSEPVSASMVADLTYIYMTWPIYLTYLLF